MVYTLAIIGLLIQCVFIYVEHQEKYLPALILKTSASLVFVLIGIMCSKICLDPKVSKYVILGLCFGAAGDFFLNLRFVLSKVAQKVFLVGILIFLTGHVMYLITLINLATNALIPAVVGVVLTVLLLIWIFSKIEAKMAFKIFGVFYIGAVTLMATYACFNAVTLKSTFSYIYALGAILFLVSDVVLILNTFTKTTKFSLRITNLVLYYLGQLCISLSLMFNIFNIG